MEHLEEIKINDIWQNNVNLLIGSGASFGLFPTLATNMKNESIETLGKHFEDEKKYQLKSYFSYITTLIVLSQSYLLTLNTLK